jgi:hypothetical protein
MAINVLILTFLEVFDTKRLSVEQSILMIASQWRVFKLLLFYISIYIYIHVFKSIE